MSDTDLNDVVCPACGRLFKHDTTCPIGIAQRDGKTPADAVLSHLAGTGDVTDEDFPSWLKGDGREYVEGLLTRQQATTTARIVEKDRWIAELERTAIEREVTYRQILNRAEAAEAQVVTLEQDNAALNRQIDEATDQWEKDSAAVERVRAAHTKYGDDPDYFALFTDAVGAALDDEDKT